MQYNVPAHWVAIYSEAHTTSDFEGDVSVPCAGILIGWKTGDGFISPDKLDDKYKVKHLEDDSEIGDHRVTHKARGFVVEHARENEDLKKQVQDLVFGLDCTIFLMDKMMEVITADNYPEVTLGLRECLLNKYTDLHPLFLQVYKGKNKQMGIENDNKNA